MPFLTENERTQIKQNKARYAYYLQQITCPIRISDLESGSAASNPDSLLTNIKEGALYTSCSERACILSSARCTSTSSTASLFTDDLIIHFEASDIRSYPGSGLTWFNIGSGGSAYNGVFSGAVKPFFAASPIQSISFSRNVLNNGTDYLNYNYISVTRPPSIGDDFTFLAWINTTNIGNGTNHYQLMYIVSTETGGVNNDFGFGLNNSGQLAYGDGKSGGSDITISTDQAVNTGRWTFVAVSRQKSNGNVNLYINGLLAKSGTCNSGNTLSQATTMLIGSETDFVGYTFGGLMGAFLANTTVLTAEKIYDIYQAQKSLYGL